MTASASDGDPYFADSSAAAAAPSSAAAHGDAADEGTRELRSSRSSSKFIREQLDSLAAAGGAGGGGGSGGGRKRGFKSGSPGESSGNRVKMEDIDAAHGRNGSSNGDNASFEEDEDVGALQWGNLQKLDQSDDKTAPVSVQAAQRHHVEDVSDVAAAATALLSASGTLPAIERNGMAAAAAAVAAAADRMDDSHSAAAIADKQPHAATSMRAPIVGATFQPASYIPIMPRPQPPGTQAAYPYPPAAVSTPQSPSSAPLDGKRKHSSLTHSPSSSTASSPAQSNANKQPPPPPPAAPLPPSASSAAASAASNSGSSAGSSSRKRRKKEDEENSLNLAYERQISLLNEAIRQLLAYVSPLHSQADAYVDELITGYRSEYMKEQLREGRTSENKRYARAMSGYFLSFYSSSNLNTQLALQHVSYYPPTGTAPATGATTASPTSSSALASVSGSSTPVGGTRPDALIQQRLQADTWEGLSHPLYSNLTLLMYTVIDALLMDALQIALWSLYLERLEPFFILDPSPQSQARMLLLTAYAVKLAYCGNHDIYLPYLTGLYAQFSKLFADYIHAKGCIRLGVSNTQLTARYRLMGSLRDKE